MKRYKIIHVVAVVSTIISMVLYFAGFQQLAGYSMWITVPSCVAAVVVERHFQAGERQNR